MDVSRFDTISKLFADRRLSRRQTIAGSGAVLTAAAIGLAGITPVAAQDATPDTTPSATGETGPAMLFVQSFDSGTITPKTGDEGRFTLALAHGLGQTLYFSDRPDRIVGARPTDQFLQGLGFPEDNPPNAALLVDDGEGGTNIAVIELYNPVYDAAGPNLTYDVAVLEDFEREVDLTLSQAPSDLSGLASSFGAAHLFIDDCPDGAIDCYYGENPVGTFGNQGHCFSWAETKCLPCANWSNDQLQAEVIWGDLCTKTFPACDGYCTATGVCTYGDSC